MTEHNKDAATDLLLERNVPSHHMRAQHVLLHC